MLTFKLPSALTHVVIIPVLKCKSKDPEDVNNYRPIAIATALSNVLVLVLLTRLAKYPWTADRQFGFKEHMVQKWPYILHSSKLDFYRNQDTPVYMCFLDAKKGM